MFRNIVFILEIVFRNILFYVILVFGNIFYLCSGFYNQLVMEEHVTFLTRIFHRKLAATPLVFYRYLYDQINWEDSLIGLKGPKGCGKTTLLLQHIKKTFPGKNLDKVLYISLDNLWFASHDLIELVEYVYTHGVTHLFIDEIHYYKQWKAFLKNLYDDYPGLNVVYTGSSMLQLESSEADLSRRLTMYEMRGLSFREYLEYENIIALPALSFEDVLRNHVDAAMSVCERIKVLEHFRKYLEVGYYPFYKQVHHGYYQRIENIVNQTLEVDYPNIEEVTVSTIRKTRKLLMIIAEQVPQLPKMSELYRALDTDRNQGLRMLNALQRGGLLQLLGDNTKNVDKLSRPDKIYLGNPTLMYTLTPQVDKGTLRETFFMNQLSQAHEMRYPASGDFLVDRKHLFEVGGKGKTFDQIKDLPDSYLAVDNTEIGRKNRIPLWLFGFLY